MDLKLLILSQIQAIYLKHGNTKMMCLIPTLYRPSLANRFESWRQMAEGICHISHSLLSHLLFPQVSSMCNLPRADSFHTYSNDTTQHASHTLCCKHVHKMCIHSLSVLMHASTCVHTHKYKHLRTHTRTVSQNLSVEPGISHSFFPCLFPL